MSASLVGSEMCIRDSPEGFRRAFGDLPERFRRAVREFLESLRRVSSSVSYTHLTLPTICSV
eukprot:5474746-Alexandrium_andersonii.AAC.1